MKFMIINRKKFIQIIVTGLLLSLILLLVLLSSCNRKAAGGYPTIKYKNIKSITIIDSKGKSNQITQKELIKKILQALNNASLSNKAVDSNNKWRLKIMSKPNIVIGIKYNDISDSFAVSYGDMNKNKGGVTFIKSNDLYKYAVKPYFNKEK